MTREDQLACLTDRPCSVCKHHKENGCCKWNCVFEEEAEDVLDKLMNEMSEMTFFADEDFSGTVVYWDDVVEIINKHRGDKE